MLTETQTQQLVDLKRTFPFRIVFGMTKPETGEFQLRTAYTKQTPRNWARKGWTVFVAN